ncbi:globin-coupled sensor protein [Sporolactobacillus putidus]|uniref:Heme-based aerotactic transducer HemAT n=1 Tax=Sporolactobacillus putidus TaxID=492735 RepID=A0A917RX11_9BACL|nr:globin-coupled sensor protein [Sporolactobacillus putidus]GGL43171.1 heme-based aerotactic transducer HemAT [Sporolactobacillus putidus]
MFFKKSEEAVYDWLEKAKSEKVSVTVKDSKVLEKLRMLDLTDGDLQLLKLLRPFVQKEIDIISKDFYNSFYKIEPLRQIIDKHSSVEKLSRTLAAHVMELFSGVIDEAFLERRFRVGKMHYIIALSPSYYMGTFQNLQNSLCRVVFQSVGDFSATERIIRAIHKIISFEQQIVLEAYDLEYSQNLKREYEGGREDLRSAIVHVGDSLTALADQTRETVSALSEHFQSVRASSAKSNRETQTAKAQASEGQTQLERLFSQVTAANQSIVEMGRMVGRLEESSQEIGRVTILVREISEQTNILALNSAIEAARAGEYGKGFAVVSQEIRKLAEETNNAMAQISDLIDKSVNVTSHVVGSLNETTGIIEKGMEESKQTADKFRDIISSVDRNSRLSAEIDKNMDELVGITGKLGTGTETLSVSLEQLKNSL